MVRPWGVKSSRRAAGLARKGEWQDLRTRKPSCDSDIGHRKSWKFPKRIERISEEPQPVQLLYFSESHIAKMSVFPVPLQKTLDPRGALFSRGSRIKTSHYFAIGCSATASF
jgi:hypothetical protein